MTNDPQVWSSPEGDEDLLVEFDDNETARVNKPALEALLREGGWTQQAGDPKCLATPEATVGPESRQT